MNNNMDNLSEPSYVREILPDYWWNDIGVMEKAFTWTADERKILDDAYKRGTYGRGRFGDDLSEYTEILRNMIRNRLRELALEEYEANHRA